MFSYMGVWIADTGMGRGGGLVGQGQGEDRRWRAIKIPEGPSFFSNRPWNAGVPPPPSGPALSTPRPTHLLSRHLAYPITANPLTIGTAATAEGHGIRIEEEPGGIDSRHCTVHLQAEQVVLTDLSTTGTFLNERRVEGAEAVRVGDAIRLGKNAATIEAIACLDRDEA